MTVPNLSALRPQPGERFERSSANSYEVVFETAVRDRFVLGSVHTIRNQDTEFVAEALNTYYRLKEVVAQCPFRVGAKGELLLALTTNGEVVDWFKELFKLIKLNSGDER